MATDNSPPRVRAIFVTMVISFTILVGLKFLFDSYYHSMFEEEEYAKIGSIQSEQLLQLRASEKRNLTSSPIPIDRAMQLLSKSREEASSGLPDGGIVPEPSNDPGALIGWQKLPHELTAAELGNSGDAGAVALAAAGDAGDLDAGVSDASANAALEGGALVNALSQANSLPDAGRASKQDAGSSAHP